MKFSIKTVFVVIFSLCLCSCTGPVPVDVVMLGGELFFVLEEEHEISAIQVAARNPNAGTNGWNRVWALGHDPATPVNDRTYPKVKQIKYGQRFAGFPDVTGPFELQKNMEYSVGIFMGSKFAREIFIITSDNRAVMPHPAFERQKGRTYAVSVDKDGNKTLILESVKK